ncbi:Gfo/Idh/MocA family protein [Planctomycetota bacterium]
MKRIRFGVIGCGLMGREFGSSAVRWCHLLDMQAYPEIVAVCDTNKELYSWFQQSLPTVQQATQDYHQLLANPDVDAVYCAVPHNLHEKLYCDTIKAGKHLMGEKPFGIDKKANEAITACIKEHPDVFVRCCSQFPFYPGAQRIGQMIEAKVFGQIIEVNSGILHSSDLDPDKPINWKRMIEYNGEYGCMGDLGLHICHLPLRAGWVPKNVRAILSNIIPNRFDRNGKTVPCKTWDNATLFCESLDPATNNTFPMTLKAQRIAPGEKNSWYIEILGTKASARFSTKNPACLQIMEYKSGQEQVWQQIDIGYETTFKAITGSVFEFGFPDAILQMWAAFIYELNTAKPLTKFSSCATPEEAAISHRLFTAALESQKHSTTVTFHYD